MSQEDFSPHLLKIGHIINSAFTKVTYVIGGLYQDWILRAINWATVPYILLGLAAVMVPLKLVLRARAKQYLPPLNYGISQVGNGLSNIVIGALGVAWFNLALGLSPFFLVAPLTMAFVALYFVLIIDVFWLKGTFRKATSLLN
jgi:hypothetical protein